jgi:hypothetical protein
LKEHAESIASASSLNLADFWCRYLVVDDIWIPLGESLLISRFKPLWNITIEGFGNHDPGEGRREGKKPLWDVLHPGRKWAEQCSPNKKTVQDIEKMIHDFFAKATAR